LLLLSGDTATGDAADAGGATGPAAGDDGDEADDQFVSEKPNSPSAAPPYIAFEPGAVANRRAKFILTVTTGEYFWSVRVLAEDETRQDALAVARVRARKGARRGTCAVRWRHAHSMPVHRPASISAFGGGVVTGMPIAL
jgi:hypothetical protein